MKGKKEAQSEGRRKRDEISEREKRRERDPKKKTIDEGREAPSSLNHFVIEAHHRP